MDRFKEIYNDNKWLEEKTAEQISGKSHENQKKNFDLDVADEKELYDRFSVLDNQVEWFKRNNLIRMGSSWLTIF